MRNTYLILSALLALVIAMSTVGSASAQMGNPSKPPHGGGMTGGGMMGGSSGGMMGTGGALRTYMIDVFAQAIGMSSSDMQARLNAGETMWQVARSLGLSDKEILAAMSSAHDKALEQAVKDGIITADQAKWMDEHMDQMFSTGSASCHGANSGSMMNWQPR
jgi:hypothetical protein